MKPPANLLYSEQVVDKIAGQLELAHVDLDSSFATRESQSLNIATLESEIRKIAGVLNKTRCVLLLDDAAHAFSPEQQRDFFDFFRQVKSNFTSPKAAIYPGVTTYSSTFHAGHDAEVIDVWIKPDSAGYVDFMLELLHRRLPDDVYAALLADRELLDVVCYAAFGMPRALLNMVRTFYAEDSNVIRHKMKYGRLDGLQAIKACLASSINIYTSLKVKLPIYEKFITSGEHLFAEMIELVKEYNKGKDVNHQSDRIGIRQPLPPELSKVLGFLQYSGLLLPKDKISTGGKGIFEVYTIHYAALITRNALLGKKKPSIDLYAEALHKRHAEFKRITPTVLMGTTDPSVAFPLSLPPCQACNTSRINEHAKFCLNCGSPLKTASTFESLVAEGIEKLPLTPTRVDQIKKHSRIRSIKDILMDHDRSELRGVKGIGPYWANKIYSYAEEYIA